MVVIDCNNMLTSPGNQYLQPDYLSPLPTTLDAKKSPLALLAQTCSQIGADTPPTKPLLSSLEKPKKSSGDSASRTTPKSEKSQRGSPTESVKLAFKPYDLNVVSRKSEDSITPTRPSSKNGAAAADDDGRTKKTASPSRKSPVSVLPVTTKPSSNSPATSETGMSSPASSERKATTTPSARSASPIIRSGLEIMQGHTKAGGALSALNPLCCPPGLEHHHSAAAAAAMTNPAFRPPFAGAPYAAHHHAAAAAAMLAASGYPAATPPSVSPYLSYARVKTPSGGETLVPVCKDPYCTGCPYSVHNPQHQQLLMAGGAATSPCPSGCTQCDHQKYSMAMAAMSLVPPSAGAPSPHSAAAAASLAYQQHLGRPYVCNWIAGESYCGKRFGTSDELLQHLRTHTSSSVSDSAGSHVPTTTSAAIAAAAAASVNSSFLSATHPLFSNSALHRAAAAAAAGYSPSAPLSPLSAAAAAAAAARYHPYAKPPTTLASAMSAGMPPGLSASPYSAFNPTALSAYYSPYAMYGPRLGAAAAAAAAVHP